MSEKICDCCGEIINEEDRRHGMKGDKNDVCC